MEGAEWKEDAVCTSDSYLSPYLLRPCRSHAEARRYSARGLSSHCKTLTGPYRGEQPMSVTTADASCSANREENK